MKNEKMGGIYLRHLRHLRFHVFLASDVS